MASERPSSSWHPALMPDHQEPTAFDSPASLHNGTPLGPDPPALNLAQDDTGVDAWLAGEETEMEHHEGGAWLDSEQSAPKEADAPQQHVATSHTDDPAAEGHTQRSHDTNEKTPPDSPQVGHASRMSFARTASQFSFHDDDDPEWNISRSNTDHFKFMPPSDRTNSFPAVPPMTSSPNHDDQPLSSNQALDIVEESEKDTAFEDHLYQTQASNHPTSGSSHVASHSPDSRHAPSLSMGGEVQAFQGQAADARYEEGVPLISHQSDEAQAEEGSNPFEKANDTNHDGFLAQVNDAPQTPQADDFKASPLERKSTEQVLSAFENEPLSRQQTLNATAEEDETNQLDSSQPTTKPTNDQPSVTEDLDSKWQEAFGDSDEDGGFLFDGAGEENPDIDPIAFLGSDDEGFLGSDDGELPDDTEATPLAPQSVAASSQPASRQVSASNPYAPQGIQHQPQGYQPQAVPGYVPAQALPVQPVAGPYGAPTPPNSFNPAPQFGGRPPLPGTGQSEIKAQSFADKSRGGYSSPYDLPSDIVSAVPKPRKRPSMQSLYAPSGPQVAPPATRSTSMFAPQPTASNSRPGSKEGSQEPPLAQKASMPVLRNKGSFFEELPMQSKVRPGSRHSARAPSPAQYAPQMPPPGPSPLGPPMGAQAAPPHPMHPIAPPLPQMQPPAQYTPGPSPLGPAMGGPAVPPPQQPQGPAQQSSAYGNLVAPERVSPYSALQNATPLPTPSANSRYSPAPSQQTHGGAALQGAVARYSPAPAPRVPSGYSPNRGSAATPPILPHLPRTSSPLAHFESRSAQGPDGHMPHVQERRSSSSSYEPRLVRAPSLAPTREVDEEDDQSGQGASLGNAESKYGTVPTSRHTPPPQVPHSGQSILSPPKRSGASYAPQALAASQEGFVPPPRAQTQSPGAAYGNRPAPQRSGSVPRPSAAYSPTSPVLKKATQTGYAPQARGRGHSLTMNLVTPTDGREQDPLQRWKGVPIIAWGVGGTLVTSFPKSIPRYAMGSSVPTITRVPGEVHVKSIKEVDPLPDHIAKFPGPLKGKSKKKETITWLTSGIESLEKELPEISFHSELSLETKRSLERLLLWKILRIFIEHDGILEGTPAVKKAVRDLLSPGTITPTSDDDAMFPGDPRLGTQTAPITHMQADGADSSTMEQVRLSLLKGERESAVWSAVDKRLWGHAMLIANTVSPDLYKKVAQEFVRKEVNHPGHANESLAALYMILSGNHDDCVDELVPSHARAGFQLISTDRAGPTKGAMDGLDKWRETLTLVLSNRSTEDIRGLNSLGNLLAGYGRAEAAHICYLFSRTISVFGGMEEPNVNFVLLGSDHRHQVKETEALQLSEVYEYGISLAGASPGGAPHLAAYKLQHALTLAEYGYREKALQYCDAIATAMSSQTKRSPYYNGVLATAVDEFMTRLKQAPKGESSSWISKPSMNKVSDSMWNKFNKFVAGDDAEGKEGAADGENGPFARIGTPTISRSPSVNNFEMYGGAPTFAPAGVSAYASAAPVTGAASKYAPHVPQAQGLGSPYEPTAQASAHNPYAPSSQHASAPNPYAPSHYEPSSQPPSQPRSSDEYPRYQPSAAAQKGYAPPNNGTYSGDQQTPATEGNQPQTPIYGGYQPYGLQESASMPALASSQAHEPSQSYQPPSYGYEPPQLNASAPDLVSNKKEDQSGISEYEPPSNNTGGYEPPSFQPYEYEPPSYQPNEEASPEDGDDAPKPKKKSFMDDDEDDIPSLKANANEKSKADKDRENQELFRKAAEEDAKRAAEQQAGGKKGWLGGWFGKRAESPKPGEQQPKAVKANLGETSSFVYDPDLKRWINKKPGAENVEKKTATPPPPRAGGAGTPPPMSGTPPPPSGRSVSGGPPPRSMPSMPILKSAQSVDCLSVGAPPMARSISGNSFTGAPALTAPPGGSSAPPSRPTTSMSNASSIDDLLGAPGPRKGGKKPRKSGRYVDVMANN